jgi:hypothetical protein
MAIKKKAYTMNWMLLIQTYNNQNAGKLTQSRLAEIYGQSRALISLDQSTPRNLKTLENKYSDIHIKQFESIVPFKNILIEHEIIDKKT